MTRRFLLVLTMLAFCGCGGQTLHVYNDTGQTLKISVGGQTANQSNEVLQQNLSVGLSRGAKITVEGDKGFKEEVTIDVDPGHDVIYKVGGKYECVVVDFSKMYAKKDELTNAADKSLPFTVVSDLAGKKLYTVPPCRFIDAHEPFPKEVPEKTKVMRLEPVPKVFRNHGIAAYVAKNLAGDLQRNADLYRR